MLKEIERNPCKEEHAQGYFKFTHVLGDIADNIAVKFLEDGLRVSAQSGSGRVFVEIGPVRGDFMPHVQVRILRLSVEGDVLGIDLVKQVFQLYGADRKGQVLHRSKISRPGLITAIMAFEARLSFLLKCFHVFVTK
jgi:hypothetical protein